MIYGGLGGAFMSLVMGSVFVRVGSYGGSGRLLQGFPYG